MTINSPSLPAATVLLWMLVMQPVSLHRRLKACGIEKPTASGWRLWYEGEANREACRAYVAIMVRLLVSIAVVSANVAAGFALAAGHMVSWFDVLVAVGLGVGLGIVVGIVFSMSAGVILAIYLGVVLGSVSSVTLGVVSLVVFVVAYGFIDSITRGLSTGVAGGSVKDAVRVALGAQVAALVYGMVVALVRIGNVAVLDSPALLGRMFDGLMDGLTIGLGFAAVWMASVWRTPIGIVEGVLSSSLYWIQRLLSIDTLRFAPVLYHDLGYIPHPFLASHLLLSADREPALVRRVLNACAIAPGQGRIGRTVLATLQARELNTCAREHRFSILADPDLSASGYPAFYWLRSSEASDPIHLAFREVARYLAAAESAIPYHRLGHLRRASAQLKAIGNDLLADSSPVAQALRPTLHIWKTVTSEMRRKAKREAAGYLPNPFRPGDALDPEQGREVFRGRDDIARQIESLLADPAQSLSIALLGPRRSGKSSLLKMLPALLPDAVCIFFDLQDHPTDSPAGFFRELARTARDQARRDHRLDLPPLPEGSPFEAGSAWLRSLDELAGNRRILLCIDEFERLESLFPGDHADLLRLMGLFRGTIQHRRKLRLLVSGAAPFEELSGMWNDHFINVQEIRLDLLDEPTSVELLRHPIPDFPDDAIPEPVAREVFARTGGQPLLLQAFGAALVFRLNDQQAEPRRASLADVDAVQEQILQRYRPFFADTMNPEKIPPAARAALLALALGDNQAPDLDARTRRWLRQRCLLTDDDRLRIPVLGAWIREEGLE